MSDIDRNINWKNFYSQYLKGIKDTGINELSAKCPFHEDKHASMSINKLTGLWICHACGKKGNGQTFLQEYTGCSREQAIKDLSKKTGVTVSQKKFSLEQYAKLKKLPLSFLENLMLRNNKKIGIAIPYMDESGAVSATRQRYSGDSPGPRFSWIRGSKVQLYGLWKLPEIRKEGYVFLIEGESDAQTLWYHGFPALGVPGASTFQISWVSLFTGLDIIIYQEPDIGGETFVRKVCECLIDGKYSGMVKVCTLQKHKDPSELHISNPDVFKNVWREVMNNAQKINIREKAIRPDELITGAPVQARQPIGWRMDENRGIFLINDKGLMINICPVPVLLSKRLRNIDTGDEKIELSFKRDGNWHNITSNRSTVFQRRTVTTLTDRGLPLTSENAGMFVKYLGDMEAENLDLLPLYKSTERLGWITSKKFLPGLAEDIILDIDNGMKPLSDSYSSKGSFDTWKKEIKKVRINPIARFMIASSFAAPLLKLLNHRIFIIHSWGDTRSGKTAALKAALSVWGEPDALMANFNATRVGLERMANFYNDLPLGIDERQVAGNKQDFVDSLIYLLGLGKGKTRGAKTGGLQATSTWRCVVITTGEDPLIHDSSQGGIRTRVLEIYGKPFNDEDSARRIHQICSETYGHAGVIFVKKLLDEIVKEPGFLKEKYSVFMEGYQQAFPKSLGSHISAIAITSIADYLASKWIWEVDDTIAENNCLSMGQHIISRLENIDSSDITSKAFEFVSGWITSNEEKFKTGCNPPRYGFKDNDDRFCIIPAYLENALTEAGFTYRKIMTDFAERNYVETRQEGTKKRYSLVKRFSGVTNTVRVIVFNNIDNDIINNTEIQANILPDGSRDDDLPF